jgi:hypothetical protein
MPDDPGLRRDFLLREYANLPQLIAHWDAHFWQKSQFFFAVESLLLAAVAVGFRQTFLEGEPPSLQKFHDLVALSVFNFWLCYVWFRTNRSNREFLGPLLRRARAIECALAALSKSKDGLPEDQPTFTAQWQSLHEPRRDRHSSHWWENHLPTGFALSWVVVLITVASSSHERLCWTLLTVLLALLTLVLVEVLHPRRSTRGG